MNSIPDIVGALRTGRPADAERLARAALQRSPQVADLRLLLAMALHQQQHFDAALAEYRALVEQHPDSDLHWGNYATALRDAGRPDEAVQAYRRAVELGPDNALQWFNLGLLELERHEPVAARESLLRACELQPHEVAFRIHAARACTLCRDQHAEELLAPWRRWLPLDGPLQLELAGLQLTLGEAAAARVLLEDLLARGEAPPRVRLLLAAVYERVNQLEDARRLLADIKRDMPAPDPESARELAHQQAVLRMRDGQLSEARDGLLACGPRTADDYPHFFMLGDIEDKLGDYPAALASLGRAHELQLAELRQTAPHRFEPGAPLLPAAVGRVSREQYAAWPALSTPEEHDSPVFIVGFPRSGTTLLEQMLDAHPALQSMDERPFFNRLADTLTADGLHVPEDLGRLGQEDCDRLRIGYLNLVCSKIERRWDARLVDKNPLNMLWLPMIHRLFPRARFILALRHPCDVLVSNYMQNYRSASLAVACGSFEHLARAYVEAMDCWLHHVEVFQPQVLVSRYEALVADPVAHTARIGEFLGLADASPLLQFDRRAREKGFIATPSYTQVIQPVSARAVDRWLRYREALDPVLPILQPMLDRWGYAVPEQPVAPA